MILTICLWAYFVCHACSEFLVQLEHERRVLQEARILSNTVCNMPRDDIAGNLVNCEQVRTTAIHHSPRIKAVETTVAIITTDLFFVFTEGLRGASHAVGLMGFVVCFILYISSLIVRSLFVQASENNLKCTYLCSPSLQEKHQSHVSIHELDPGAPPHHDLLQRTTQP